MKWFAIMAVAVLALLGLASPALAGSTTSTTGAYDPVAFCQQNGGAWTGKSCVYQAETPELLNPPTSQPTAVTGQSTGNDPRVDVSDSNQPAKRQQPARTADSTKQDDGGLRLVLIVFGVVAVVMVIIIAVALLGRK